MPITVNFHIAAQSEFVNARRWYAAKADERVAEAFVDAVDSVVQTIAARPDLA